MTQMQGPRPGDGTRSNEQNTYAQGTPGFEHRDQLLQALRANGYEPYCNDEHNYRWFIRPCPNHGSPVPISAGKTVTFSECSSMGEKCTREDLVQAFGLSQLIETESSTLDKLRAALVDSAGLDDIEPPAPLIDGVLQLDSIAWLQGKPGHGKSFVSLDMAGCVGTGNVWQGFRSKPGSVLYLAAEGVSGVRQRVRAWESAMGQPMANVQFLPVAVQSTNEPAWKAFVQLAGELKPVMIILDTQARITVGAEENSARDMGQFVHRLEQVRTATGACVLVVHHEGKGSETMRGSTAMEGAATTIIRAKKTADEIELSCVKQKDAVEFENLSLRVVPMEQSAIICLNNPMSHSTVLTGQEEKLVSSWRETFETDLVSVTALVDATGIPKPTVSRSVKKLVRQGLAVQLGTDYRPLYQLR